LKYPMNRYFFGKVTMYTSYNIRARNMLLNFLNQYFSDSEQLAYPLEAIDYDGENPYYNELFAGQEYKEAYKILSREVRALGENIPPLINSYMNLSPTMKVFGTAINKKFGGVEETGILVNIHDIYPEKLERYISPIRIFAKNLKNKWWKNMR